MRQSETESYGRTGGRIFKISRGPRCRRAQRRSRGSGLDRKPVLGWSSWSFIREQPTAAKLEAQAHAMQSSGLQQLGYEYINLDDFWEQCPGPQGPNVDRYGRWVIDASRFPADGDTNGIKVVADHIHSLGMKFGIYVTPGISKQAVAKKTSIEGTPYTADQIAEPAVSEANYNSKGMVRIDYSKPGAQALINSWVDMFASWGVDYIKIDGMSDKNVPDIKAWSEAIRQSGRPMVLDVTQGSYTRAIAPTLMKYANQWEFAPDVDALATQEGQQLSANKLEGCRETLQLCCRLAALRRSGRFQRL